MKTCGKTSTFSNQHNTNEIEVWKNLCSHEKVGRGKLDVVRGNSVGKLVALPSSVENCVNNSLKFHVDSRCGGKTLFYLQKILCVSFTG